MSRSPSPRPRRNRRNEPNAKELPDDAPAEQRFAALRRDFAGLTEICRWQWQLLQQIQTHLARLPPDWPAPARPPQQPP